MSSKSSQRKHIIPKLNLSKISTQNRALSSRETSALINSHRELESHRALTFDSRNKYKSERSQLWSSSMFTARKNKTYEQYKNEMHDKIWKDSSETNLHKLHKEVNELTSKLDNLRIKLSSKQISFKEAGKILAKIRNESEQKHHHINGNNNNDDLIFCLDLIEKLWKCCNGDGLSCSEFSELLSNMLRKDKNEFNILFQKMDADGDKTLSWAEYISFLSQQQSHLWDKQEMKNISYFHDSKSINYNLETKKRYSFKKICILKGNNSDLTNRLSLNSIKYALLTSNDEIEIRNSKNLQLESCIDLSLRPNDNNNKYKFNTNKTKEIKSCTNFCSIDNNKNNNNNNNKNGITRLAVSFMDRSINIYQPSFIPPNNLLPIYLQSSSERKKFNNKIHYHLEHGFYALDIPQCMELYNNNQLLVGETYGTIALYNYIDHNCLIRKRKHGISNNDNNNNGQCVVKQVSNIPRIGIVSCGMDNSIVITDTTKWNTTRILSGHIRGVYSFTFSLNHRMLISLGYDRKCIVWDPYIIKPLGLLKGNELSSVIDVIINDSTNQIITASIDNKIKIYDIRTWKCLQTIRESNDNLSSILYDRYQSCLITAGSKIKKWFVQNDDNNDKKKRGENINICLLTPIVSICYSNIFKQIISIHVDEMCILWDIETGLNSFQFKMSHIKGDSIITSTIDEIGKRLLTVSQNGVIKMWNFSNGAIMHQFDKIDFQITKLIYLPRTLHCVVGCGYSSNIVRFPSHQAPIHSNFILKSQNIHKTDVRSMCISKDYLYTASSDGMIVEWHIDSNINSQIFYCPNPYLSVTAITIKHNFLFIGTEQGVIHIFEKKTKFKFISSIKSDKYIFKDSILDIAINEKVTRLMICDCHITMKLFDISNLSKRNDDFILMKEWKPHKNGGCNTALLYIPKFNVFCSSSDNGELILWNQDGMFLGQFGSNIKWNLFDHCISPNSLLKKNRNNNGPQTDIIDDNCDNEEIQKTRSSYFDDHNIYRPKFIRSVVSESMTRTLLEDKIKTVEKTKEKSQFEKTLDKLMTNLLKVSKRRE